VHARYKVKIEDSYNLNLKRSRRSATTLPTKGEKGRKREMILATTKVEDFDRWLKIFSTTSAEKRKQHGCKGSTVFRDPNEDDRVWVLFDWDEKGWQSFVSDPEVLPILKEAGHKGKPQMAKFGGQYKA
jgi:quinol monooxygenase YgiN